MTDFMNDAQGALSFLVGQASHIEAGVYRIKYEDIQYPDLIDIDTSGGEWAQTVEFFSMDGVGKAKWFNHLSRDVPNAEVSMAKHTHQIEMAAIGYRYTLAELGYAQRLGVQLDTERAAAARRAYEEFIDDLVKNGDTTKGMESLYSNSSVGAAQVAYIATTPMSADSSMTILDYLQKANVFTATTGQPLQIRAVGGLESKGAGSSHRMVARRKSPEVAKLHLPVPLRFLAPQGPFGMTVEVPGYFRTGGVEVRLPGAIRYRDGI